MLAYHKYSIQQCTIAITCRLRLMCENSHPRLSPGSRITLPIIYACGFLSSRIRQGFHPFTLCKTPFSFVFIAVVPAVTFSC